MRQFKLLDFFRSILCWICVFFVLVPASGFTKDLQVEDILSALEKKYSHKSFHADFTQETLLAALDIKDDSSGKVWFSHPGKMKWQYLKPRHHEFITNGKTLWFYQPLENQVSISDAAQFFKAGAGGAFLSDFSQVRTHYTVRIKNSQARDTNNEITLELIPKQPIPDVAGIEITVALPGYDILRVLTRNPHDNTTTLHFGNIEFVKTDPAWFEFTPPDDISIIQLD